MFRAYCAAPANKLGVLNPCGGGRAMGGARAALRLAAVALLCSVAALAAAPWQDRKTDPGNNPVTGKACAFDGSCPFSRYVGAGGRRACGSQSGGM